MAANEAQIAQVRRWTLEPLTEEGTYTDEDVAAIIEQYPLLDERGVQPYWFDTSTEPPTKTDTVGWYPTYDLHAAAAHIWEEKTAALSEEIDCTTETQIGTVTKRLTQKRDFALKQARYHNGRRSMKTATLIAWPSRNRLGNSVVGNLAEVDP